MLEKNCGKEERKQKRYPPTHKPMAEKTKQDILRREERKNKPSVRYLLTLDYPQELLYNKDASRKVLDKTKKERGSRV